MKTLKVLKFGGTSVGSPERLRSVAGIVDEAAANARLVVVTSAASGVTDRLVAGWDAATQDPAALRPIGAVVLGRYEALASRLLDPLHRARYRPVLEAGTHVFDTLTRRIESFGPLPAYRDELLAVGERLMAPLLALVLQQFGPGARPVDATDLIRTNDAYGEAGVDTEATRRLVQHWYRTEACPVLPVVTGFIGATAEGVTTTLGRGGSDYSAALLASALRAEVLERWTDVDGIYTDDPRTNRHAKRLAYLVLEEAWAWNHAGRLGMHRKALDPLVAAHVPVHIRSTEAPALPGTLILPAGHPQSTLAQAL